MVLGLRSLAPRAWRLVPTRPVRVVNPGSAARHLCARGRFACPAAAGFSTLVASQAMSLTRLQCREPVAGEPAVPPTGSAPKKDDPEMDSFIDKVSGMITSAMTRLGMGGLLGFCAGVALRRATKEAAFVAGSAFIFLQVLAWRGYIEIKWQRIRGDVICAVDTDGDGEITAKDVKHYVRRLFGVLVYQLPSTSGFGLGLVYGFKFV
mmetsp:Transcript_12857/g.43542  ORF Transcript_12857/g.43542 Transcript_12857/m.43542 type:complete len:207 (+) Transcript_12857:34-654(+)